MNVIGVAFNPSKLPLECFSIKNIKNVREKENDNGFNSFVEKLENSFVHNKRVLYYWLFDTKKIMLN